MRTRDYDKDTLIRWYPTVSWFGEREYVITIEPSDTFMQTTESVTPRIIQYQTVSVIPQTESIIYQAVSIIPAAKVAIQYIHSPSGLSTAAPLMLAALCHWLSYLAEHRPLPSCSGSAGLWIIFFWISPYHNRHDPRKCRH